MQRARHAIRDGCDHNGECRNLNNANCPFDERQADKQESNGHGARQNGQTIENIGKVTDEFSHRAKICTPGRLVKRRLSLVH
jgi:hypothetical protein